MEFANPIPFDEGSFMDGKHADLFAQVARDLHTGYAAASLVKQRQWYELNQAAAKIEHACMDGWNEEDYFLDIPENAYYYWVNRLGPQCWEDQGFRRRFAKKYPECVRRNVTGHTVITKPQPKWDVKRAISAATNPESARILEHMAG